MLMHNPPHPGEVCESFVWSPLGISGHAAAEGIWVLAGKTLSAVFERKGRVLVPKWLFGFYCV